MGEFLQIDDTACEGIPELTRLVTRPAHAAPLRTVVVGGGTGASVSIRALRSIGICPDAVVAMADDGGSTGLLRSRDDMTPPGDVRKCLVALAGDTASPFARAFSGRMPDIEDHALGNLLLAALEDECGSFPAAIAECERLLDACGHVYPSTLEHVRFVAKNEDGTIIIGQHDASLSSSALKRVRLACEDGAPSAYGPAVEALKNADLIVLGPGSLFTSIVPNLLIPGIPEAICESKATVVFVCSLADAQGETRGFSVLDYFDSIERYGLRGRIDYFIAQRERLREPTLLTMQLDEVDRVYLTPAEVQVIEQRDTRVLKRDLCNEQHQWLHDIGKLGSAFAEVVRECHSPQK
ncbi:MAG: YvcK family protein [Eggerthellaceae bacterium]|nr:YvcK family protein [Eggerthellaceae bacterium]